MYYLRTQLSITQRSYTCEKIWKLLREQVWDSLIRKYDIQPLSIIVTFSVFCSKAVSLQYSVHSRRHACDNIISIIYTEILYKIFIAL